jgi:hypothetical protein
MCNKEHLVAYLYGELSGRDRAAFEAHVRGCAECREELKDLGLTRQHLASWSPPDPGFDFAVVRTRRTAAPAPRLLTFVPRRALAAAAAVLILAGAAAIANVEMRYGPDGFVVRTGWGSAARPSGPAAGSVPQAAAPAPQAVPATASSEQIEAAIGALRLRLDELEHQQSAGTSSPARAGQTGMSPAELRRVLAESEARQRTEMALQVAQIWKDFNAVRARDFARVQEVVGRAQGQTNFQLKQHRDSIESLYRVSFQQK